MPEIHEQLNKLKYLLLSDSPILLSFPHFYLADDDLRTAVEGISPPTKDKHQFYIDVHPVSSIISFLHK